LQGIFDDIDQPVIKWADSREELEKAFSLVHEEYVRSGYITKPNQHHIFFNIHNLLPNSCTLIIKCGHEVIATLSMVTDDQEFGLPMDSLYKEEVDVLRKQRRKICELCSLAASPEFSSEKLLMPLFRTMYWHSVTQHIDDFCITVNPKHVPFYKLVFLFEDLGPQRFYHRVNAPAVALRLDLRRCGENLEKAYRGAEPECSVYSYVFESPSIESRQRDHLLVAETRQIPDAEIVDYFLARDAGIRTTLRPGQHEYLLASYANAVYPK
jgi:hypothetical protein